jgi:hypothetical protein
VIAAVLAFDGDYAELDALVRYTDTACTLALGGGGPPKCWDIPGAAQVEGTPVVVFPFSVCEGEWEPRTSTLARVLGMLVERPPSAASAASDVTLEVYGVFPVPADAEPSDRPAGDYAVVFATHVDDGLSGTTVRIADGGIVRIAFGCGSTFPAVMAAAFAGQSLQPPLGGLGLASDAVIATVEELPPRAVQDTSPRWRVVIDLVAPVAGYRAVLVDDRTALLHADRSVATVEELVPGMSVAVSGVPLPWSLWRADEIVIGD